MRKKRSVKDISITLEPQVCINNIKKLIAEHEDVGIGTVEKTAGFTIGYLYRAEQKNQMPSIKFLIACSKIFNVSLDVLVNYELSSTIDDREFTDILSELIGKTRLSVVKWERTIEENDKLSYRSCIDEKASYRIDVVSEIEECKHYDFYRISDAEGERLIKLIQATNDTKTKAIETLIIEIEDNLKAHIA